MDRLLHPFDDDYSFSPRFLDIDTVRMHYVDEGCGPPLLFVHGNPTWSFAWRKFITALSPTYRCIAVDHIGCGKSDKPQQYKYTLDRHVANLVFLIESLDLRDITLIGHDWGGCIGMGAAVERPDRFARFVLMNTAAFRSNRIPFRIAVCRVPVLGTIGVRGLNLFARAALWMAVEKHERMTPDVKAAYLSPYDSWANRIAIHRFVLDIPLRPSHASYARLVRIEEGLARFRDHPMLLPWGERDWCFTPWFRREFERRFPRAESFPIDDAGHYVFEDACERIIPRLRTFLDAHRLHPSSVER
jgi:pimeloyl-ACP methyl ester carboxylesterase